MSAGPAGWQMTVVCFNDDPAALDHITEAVPNLPAVFVLWPRQGEPYLAHTAMLRRRLQRLLGARETPSRFLNLRHTAQRLEYVLTGSKLESAVRMYELARLHFPEKYAKITKLRPATYVKIGLQNQFPRSHLTTRLGRAPAMYYGPFRSRAAAERFESEFLDLFQIRRCQEDLSPSPQHPGCIYGEMSMCLRPCQEIVSADEYRSEVSRAVDFLASDGRSLLTSISAARDLLSEELRFEEAARMHKRLEKVEQVLKLRDDLSRSIDLLNGVAVTRSAVPGSVELWLVRQGHWQEQCRLSFELEDGKPVPLDRKLRELFSSLRFRVLSSRERQDYLSIFTRWYCSTWRDGNWVSIDAFEKAPYRKLVHAISQVAAPSRQPRLSP